MTPWWEIHYFDRTKGLTRLNSAMVPFKLLPELDQMDIRNGHSFKTDQFEVKIPGADITLHMASRSLWIDGKPYYVENGRKVVLFQRTEVDAAGQVASQHIYLGLMAHTGEGLIVKYHVQTKTWELKIHHANGASSKGGDLQGVALPEIENN